MNQVKGVIAPVTIYSIDFTDTSTDAEDVSHGASGVQQIVFEAEGADCWIRFGTADVGAADETSWPLTAGQPMMWQVGNSQKYVRVIRQASTDGILKYYIPGQS